MRWQISEEEPRQDSEGGGDGSDAPEWRTQMRLTLPNLGEIDARIGLRGNGIRLDIEAGDEQTQALLRSAMSELRVQLDNAGLSLSAFGVTPIAEAPPASPEDVRQDA
nr:flagellar hook-length control protein FliK [Rhodocyclus gracilis]